VRKMRIEKRIHEPKLSRNLLKFEEGGEKAEERKKEEILRRPKKCPDHACSEQEKKESKKGRKRKNPSWWLSLSLQGEGGIRTREIIIFSHNAVSQLFLFSGERIKWRWKYRGRLENRRK